MVKSGRTIVFKSDSNFHISSKDGFVETDVQSVYNLDNYDLLLDDDMFIYESLGLKISSKKKIRQIIENYLKTTYPAELVKNHFFAKRGEMVLIAIPKKSFNEFSEQYPEILKKAKNISTPLLEAVSDMDEDFVYKSGNTHYRKNGSEIKIVPNGDGDSRDIVHKKDVLNNINAVQSKFNIYENTGKAFYIRQLTPALIVLLITYALFMSGEILGYKKHKNILEKKQNQLYEVYEKAGVSDNKDPYGMLLYKARGRENSQKVKINNILDKLSKSLDEETVLNSFSYKTGEITLNGSTKDLKTLENIESEISNNFKQTAKIINTDKTENNIKFSIRVTL